MYGGATWRLSRGFRNAKGDMGDIQKRLSAVVLISNFDCTKRKSLNELAKGNAWVQK